jgi:TorA maturation chaperone TorD
MNDVDSATAGELAVLCGQRAGTYTLLARLFARELDGDALAGLRASRFPAQTGTEKVDEGFRLVATYLSRSGAAAEHELACDFARCFMGQGNTATTAAYPYESVYTSPGRLLMQDARDEVLAVYRSECVDKAEGWTVGEDHLAAELEFMQVLSERCAAAAAQGDTEVLAHNVQVQRAFLADHLMRWVPDFVRLVQRFSKTDFYRGLATLTEGFLALDAEVLDELDDAA